MTEQQLSASSDSSGLLKGASIVGLVLAFIVPFVGLVASIATLIWARRTGENGMLSIWGIVVSVVILIFGVIVSIIVISTFARAASDGAIDIQALCAHRDQWGWLIDSLRYACR